jgi:hypothetical protein
MPIFRFGVRAQPTPNNPKYATWQPGHILAFIVADDESAAEKRFKAKIDRLHWKILEWKLRDELIEERVRQSGGEVLAAYELALRRGEWYRVDSEHFMAQTMAKNPISPPRPDELFLDRIIIAAGGRRLTESERGDEGQNADYILDEFVIEAKDLQEERQPRKSARQRSLRFSGRTLKRMRSSQLRRAFSLMLIVPFITKLLPDQWRDKSRRHAAR